MAGKVYKGGKVDEDYVIALNRQMPRRENGK